MINSLLKDSHITQRFCYSQNLPYSQGNRESKSHRREYCSASVNNSIGINASKPAEISFRGLNAGKEIEKGVEKIKVEKPLPEFIQKFINGERVEKLCKSEKFKNMLEWADTYQVPFGAAFGLVLTGLFRPAAIMALPSEKKNIDDKKYAAAQSIASGVIGLAIASIIGNPFSDATEKVLANPDKYLSKNKDYFKVNSSESKTMKNYLKQIPDLIPAAPKAIITIAIIPPILKYVFGLEKGKKAVKTENVTNFSSLNFKSASLPQKKVFQNFNGGEK